MKILIIGASGYLGKNIFIRLKQSKNYEIVGTCFSSNDKELVKVDLLNIEDVNRILLYKPDVIIWSVYDAMREMSLSQIGLRKIIEGISEKVRVIYVSTTIGKGKDQGEDTTPCKRNQDEYLANYINGKIEGESVVRSHRDHVVVRPGSIYGYGFDGEMDDRMKNLLEISGTNEKYQRTANLYASFVHVQDLTDAVIELVESDFKGTVNIASGKCVSHYIFNKQLASLLNIDDAFIIPDYKSEDTYHNLNIKKSKDLLRTHIRDI